MVSALSYPLAIATACDPVRAAFRLLLADLPTWILVRRFWRVPSERLARGRAD